MRKHTTYTTLTLELRTSASTAAIMHVCQLVNQTRTWPACTYILPQARGNHRDNERSERIKAYSCTAPSAARDADMRYQYKSAFFPRLTQIISCFAVSAHEVCGLQTQQPGLAVRRPTFVISPQEYARNDLKRSEIQNFPWGGHAPRPL